MKGVGRLAGVFGRGVCAGLILVLGAIPAGAHADGAAPIAETVPVGDYDVSIWLRESSAGPSTVIVLQTERGRLVASPAPSMALMVDGVIVAETVDLVAEDTGWWIAEIPVVAGTEVIVATVAVDGTRTAGAFPLDTQAPWWVHVSMVFGLFAAVVLAQQLLRQLARATTNNGIIERVGLRGNT